MKEAMLVNEDDDGQAHFTKGGSVPTDPSQGQRAQEEAGDPLLFV